MSSITDPNDPRLGHGVDTNPRNQHEVYLVLSEEERAKGWVRPYRNAYQHVKCSVNPNQVTTMSNSLSETYARDPKFYGATYCTACKMHKAVAEFIWTDGGQTVGN